MHNYKALKSASKVSVQKVKVVDRPAAEAVEEVRDSDGVITTHSVHAQSEESHEELQVVCKSYDPHTGEAQDDSVKAYSLSEVNREIDRCKEEVTAIQAKQADWEQLETDLKAL
jgi:hypothetical protein